MTPPSPLRRRDFLRATLSAAALAPVALSAQGCKLLFEPVEEALDRFLQAVAMGEDGTFIDMLEGAVEFDYIKRQMMQLKTHFRSPLYKGRTNYWAVEVGETDEANDYTVCFVTLTIPRPSGGGGSSRGTARSTKPDEEVVTFYMRRTYLRWYVLDIDPKEMDAALNKMNKNRGL